jgi:hypothetical protein
MRQVLVTSGFQGKVMFMLEQQKTGDTTIRAHEMKNKLSLFYSELALLFSS